MSVITCTVCMVMLSIWFLSPCNTVSAERILIIIPAPWYSHQVVFRSLCKALNKRGHELVVVTSIPIKDPTLKNYTEIDISAVTNGIDLIKVNKKVLQLPMLEASKQVLKMVNDGMIILFEEPKFEKIYTRNSSEKFDAVIAEAVCGPSIYALAYRFNAPLIGIISVNIHNYHRYVFGNPLSPSHPSNWELNSQIGENRSSFWQRLWNFIDAWDYMYYWLNVYADTEQKIARKYLGDDVPDILDIMKNMSILLVNQNPVTAYARPEQPNVIYFNGFHIKKTPPALSKDLQRFLDDATGGFIYVSLGSSANWRILSKGILENFVEVFSKLPYKIVWKCDFDELPRKLDNVFISKWFPQQGVLAHPNIKLFIYQGGLQSTEEAIHYAVPVLGIPIMFDQGNRIQKLVSLGVGALLELKDLTRERFDITIRQILNDESYKQRIMRVSSLTKDQPYDSMENVIWWIEYVMRHNGINHFRYSESDQPWYQRNDIDVIVILLIILLITMWIITLIIFQIVCFTFKRYYKNIFQSKTLESLDYQKKNC